MASALVEYRAGSQSRESTGWWVGGAVTLWIVALGLGFGVLWRYEITPGTGGGPPESWPAKSALQRSATVPTLVMFAHPQCACTRASLGELERLIRRFPGGLATYVVVLRPQDVGDDWDRGDLWSRVAGMTGVAAMRDLDGREARRFGVATSGHALLYDRSGRLMFSGGLTAARGREGEAPSGRDLAAFLASGRAVRSRSPVFGCALHQEDDVGTANVR